VVERPLSGDNRERVSEMRTSQEIRDELADIKRNYGKDDTQYTQEIAGWVEALVWVLSEYKEEVSV